MQYNKTTTGQPRSRYFLLLLLGAWCLLLFSTSCKKSSIGEESPDIPHQPLQLSHGKPTGEISTAQIGAEGGSLISKDGTIKIEVPAGAIDAATAFSIQEVENVLKNKAKAFRLLPENVNFKKPVTLTYNYGEIAMDGVNPDFLFLAFQDKDGYFYSANKTRGNRQNQTLTVQTTHFSDWTFYSQYDLYLPGNKLSNGEIRLGEGEEGTLELRATPLDKYDGDYAQIQLPELSSGNYIQRAVWDYAPKKGVMNSNPAHGAVVYKAPAKVTAVERVYINVTINGKLGKDNLGNDVQQMQIRQPIAIYPEGYFILAEDGVEMSAYNFSGEYIPLYGSQLVAFFPNGYSLGIYTYGPATGSFPYNMHGTPGAATIELTQNGKDGMIVFRPKECDGKDPDPYFSPGAVILKSVALKKGEYFEGEFSVTLFGYEWCQKSRAKNLSGKFRFRKTVD
ncbi:MAG TPA: hypothetical protein PKE30_11710 [Niabella sp.]|nr:hypothetical protein [Niabella sp.]